MPLRLPSGGWRLDAATVYFFTTGVRSFVQALIFTVLTVYYVTAAGLDPLQLVLVGTVLEAACLLFEVPTGVIADVFSRRLSILLGHLIFGMAYILEGSVALFPVILLAEVIRAVGETCLSGATQAWVADEVGEERLSRLFLRGTQIQWVCALGGIAASVGLASIDLSLPIVLGGALSVALAGILLITMPERHFHPLERTSWWSGLRQTALAGVAELRLRPMLLAFLAIAAAIGASSEGFDRLWEAHFLRSFTFPTIGNLEPIAWFGIFNAVGLILGIVAIQVVARLRVEEDRRIAQVSLFAHGGWLIAVIVFGLASDFSLAVMAFWTARVLQGVGQPLMASWITRNIPSQVRATVLSTLSQGDALGQMLGGPAIGVIGTVHSLRAAIVATGLLHVPVLLLLTQARRLLDAPTSIDPASPATSIVSGADDSASRVTVAPNPKELI
jgi:MFS transporter, DHA3 family, tetracycline resistance protein